MAHAARNLQAERAVWQPPHPPQALSRFSVTHMPRLEHTRPGRRRAPHDLRAAEQLRSGGVERARLARG